MSCGSTNADQLGIGSGVFPGPFLRKGTAMQAGWFEKVKRGPFFWLLPMAGVLLLFRLYPMFEAIRLSLTDASMVRPMARYVGLDTFSRIVSDFRFLQIVQATAIFVVSCIVLQLCLGLATAVLIKTGLDLKLRGTLFVRGSILVTWIIPGIVIGLIWRILLMEGRYGIVNYLLTLLGFETVAFLSAANPAMVSIIVANTWRGTAFSMIMQFAGLQRIPEQLYESARVDGANFLQQFLFVTLPQMRNIIFINLVLITIYTFNLFDMIIPLTGGGPGTATEVIALSLYRRAFSRFDLSGAAALGVLMLGINMIMAVVYYRFLVRDDS